MRIRNFFGCKLLPFLLLPGAALAPGGEPVAVRPGDPAVDGSFIRAAANRWSITQATAQGEVPGIWGTSTYEVQILQRDGRAVIRRKQVSVTSKRTVTDLALADRRTLAPIMSEESDDKGHFEHFDFVGDRVRIERSAAAPGGARTHSEVKLDMPVFDLLQGVYDLNLVALPLKEGYSAKIPVFDQVAGRAVWHPLRVTGREVAEVGGRRLECWTVETEIAKFRVVFWLAKEPPYLVKLVNYGPRGGRQSFNPM